MSGKTFVYISSWARGPGSPGPHGLTGYEFQTETGDLRRIETIEEDVLFNVTYFDRTRGVLYALEEGNDLPGLRGGGGGRVFVFRIDPDSGKLTKLGCTPTWCASPCYLTLDESGAFLIVSHQGSYGAVTKIGENAQGNYYPVVERDDVAVELFQVREDGTLGRLLDVDKRFGSGPEKRQVHARPHTAVRSPSGKLFAVCDKGDDTVSMYMLDGEKGKLIRPRHIHQHAPGLLPRYCVFHPEKPWFYHNTESNAAVYSFTYQEDGQLRQTGVCRAAPADCAMRERDLEQQGFTISRDGRYIYDIVRGPNLAAVLEVDPDDGSLKAVQHQPIPGKWPRGCALSPDGRFLLVCCLDSGEVVEFAVGADGHLSETGKAYPNHAAAYVIFCPM
ncbi:MAG: lactonase family protein [Oscillospiraceae bacterium]